MLSFTKQESLGAFVDVEGSFDNNFLEIICSALGSVKPVYAMVEALSVETEECR